ncbi:MAG: GNAT family N-acetyltransferase [Ilumatobacteraceae bacterium]
MSSRPYGHPSLSTAAIRLYGKRVMLRPLAPADWPQWAEVRQRNEQWLTPWEPMRPANLLDPTRDREAFMSRCGARDRDRQMGVAYGFGLFVDDHFAGEVNLNSVTRGALQSGTIGYWIDRARAGNRYVAEAVVTVVRFSFEQLHLHRLEICIVPRNRNSRRVMEVLAFREEGVAQRFLEINGTWEDHVRYAITAEEWADRREELAAVWL